MTRRTNRRIGVWGNILLLSLLSFGGGGSSDDLDEALADLTADRLVKFASDDEFDEWVRDLYELRSSRYATGCGGLVIGCADSAPQDKSMPADESITNVQEEGVDEGGIVKAAGDYFVILRRGRLFSVRQTTGDLDDFVPVAQVDAYPEGWTKGTWYDEMLIYGDRVVVVGFSYRIGATELGLFRLGADGDLTHEATYFLRSNDYFSSRNYASRLIDGTLVFYIPYYLFQRSSWMTDEASVPSISRWVGGNEVTEWEPIVPKTEIYRPIQGDLWPTLHTIVRCDLGEEGLDCTGRSVLGPFARTFYVTTDAVWLWVSSMYQRSPPDEAHPRSAHLYRMPLEDGEVKAVRAKGSPIDQFSFNQSPDGHINVVLVADGGGDAMWHPELASGDMALLRVPLEHLDASAPEVGADAFTPLPAPPRGTLRNRFVNDYVLWGASSWGTPEPEIRRVFLTSWEDPSVVHDIELGHAVERIEVLGDAAMVIGRDEADLHFSSLRLGEQPSVESSYTQQGAVQGETRSHGFFFRPSPEGGGILGLPLRYEGGNWSHLLYGSAEVRFLEVSNDLALRSLGALAASEEAQIDDNCKYSCVDWYGNSRPIFYRGRIFALMGYELVEGAVSEGELAEMERMSFFTPER